MSRTASPLPLVLTIGEPAGIGADIAIAAWLQRRDSDIPPFLVAGDAAFLVRRAAALGVDLPIRHLAPEAALDAFPDALPCLEAMPPVAGEPGALVAADGEAVIGSIRTAVAMVHAGRASAVVTNPINKKALSEIGFAYPGHTEFLAALSEDIFGVAAKPVMMLAGPDLRVVPVTIHIPLSAVMATLTTDLIVATAMIVAHDLKSRFAIARPRLAVSGLNPHAGEEGLLGHEDAEIVQPAVAALQGAGIDAIGPLPADTMFHPAMRQTYDAALCMYHDQALIPIKTLAFDEGVNVTLGLPFIRTSPDHGTALSLAGTGTARPDSLIAALRMADDLARREQAA